MKKIRVSRNLATSQAKAKSGKGYKSRLKLQADDQTEGLQIQRQPRRRWKDRVGGRLSEKGRPAELPALEGMTQSCASRKTGWQAPAEQ